MAEDVDELLRHVRGCEQAQRMAHVGFWRWDVGANRIQLSEELYRIYGLSPSRFDGSYERYLALVHPDNRERVRSTIGRARTTRQAVSFDERVVRSDGSVRNLRSWAAAATDEAGAVSEMFGTCLDVTDLFRVNEERAQLMELVEHSTDFIGIAELDGRIRYINAAGQRMVGIDGPEQVRTKRVGNLLTPEGMKQSLEVELPAVLRDGHWEGDVVLVNQKTGEKIETMATSFVLRDSDTGKPRWVATAQKNVTARHALENRLQHAQRMEALGRLAAGVAHDFNNLLTVILALSGVLQGDPATTQQAREHLGEIDAAAQRGATLTRQLLALSRQQVRQPRVVTLDDVVQDSAKMLSRLLPETCDLRLTLAADGARVRADVGQLEQVLLNLVVNARDAMPNGGPIAIETKAVDHQVVFEVSDQGVGMTPDVRARVFEPFFTTKETGRGTGLGLATVGGIVEQSGGAIDLKSEPDRGTKVIVSLPRVDEPADAVPISSQVLPAPRRGTVLVVEDDTAVRATMRRILEAAGYRVVDTGLAETALRIHATHPRTVDAVVTDVWMPKMDGRVLAVRLRERDSSLPIVFVSGYADDQVVREASELGPILSKPFSAQALVDQVSSLMREVPAASPGE